jgi:biotin transport system substrate-specific component
MRSVAGHPGVLMDALWPSAAAAREVALVAAGVLLLALSAQLAVPLPFTPVPLTGQPFAVLLLGALYGPRRGAATVTAYLLTGALGMPVFAAGASGVARFAGPTGGYLAGHVLAAFVVGWLAERGWDRRRWTTAVAMLAGTVVIYAMGALWLSRFVGWPNVLAAGVTPFLAGDAVKILLASALLPAAWRVVGGRTGAARGAVR